MKRALLSLLLILNLLLIPFNTVSVHATTLEDPYAAFTNDSYYENTSDLLNGIMDRLENLPASGNVNIDFLAQEILLHRILISTNINILGYTQNPVISSNVTETLQDYYGELREMRVLLSEILNNKDKIDSSNSDTEYMLEYKIVLKKLANDLSKTSVEEKPELTYIKQNLAVLQACNLLARNEKKFSKNTLTKEIAENIIKTTDRDILQLTSLINTFK